MSFAPPIPRAVLAPLLVAGALLTLPGIAGAQTPPVVDGDLTDLFQFVADLRAAGVGSTVDAPDPAGEVLVVNPEVVPCPTIVNQYFVNGFDLTRFVLAQAPGSTTLYFGMRVAGVIGDTDGNGNPDNAGGGDCNNLDNIADSTGIGPDEFYTVQFDTRCESNFDPDGALVVAGNRVTGTGLFAGLTGNEGDGSLACRGPGGHDLEVRLLNAPLPAHYRVRAFVGAVNSGLPEDFGAITQVGAARSAIRLTSAADSTTLCGGGTARVTLTVANPGDVPLLVGLTDDLPAGLTYGGIPASDCGVGAPGGGNGAPLVWPDFTLAAGAVCHVSFAVQAAVTCLGTVTNQAQVSASPVSGCLGPSQVSDQAALDFRCSGVACPTPRPCELTGTGCARSNGAHGTHLRSTFGGTVEALVPGAPADGASWEHVERDGRAVTFRWASPAAYVTDCADAPNADCKKPGATLRVEFAGTGRYAFGAGGAEQDGNMVASLVDHAAGGCDKSGDAYHIVVRTGGVVGQGDVVYELGAEVGCDEFSIHEFAVPAGPTRADGNATAADPAARVGRAAPNPFAAATSFAYEVAGAAGADVAITVYDVAGRRVRSLVAGAQATGRHTVTWDGRTDAGTPARRGVYFVRTRFAGGSAFTQRVLFLRDGQ